MNITNIHQRQYEQPHSVISEIFDTLASTNDRLWPWEIWPPMILNTGLTMLSSGGHGPIGYYLSNYDHGKSVEFTFTRPRGYIGTHTFEVVKISDKSTLLRHTINMNLNMNGIATWYLAIKWLHDALLEDCLDKVHNQLADTQVYSPHNFWVKSLRKVLKRKREKST
jgi:hypothetical protein